MTAFSIVVSIVGGCVGIAGLVFSAITIFRNGRHDSDSKSTSMAVLTSDMGYVKSGIDDIKGKQSKADEFMHTMDKQITELDQSAKSAHHRIDEHELRIVKLEHEEG